MPRHMDLGQRPRESWIREFPRDAAQQVEVMVKLWGRGGGGWSAPHSDCSLSLGACARWPCREVKPSLWGHTCAVVFHFLCLTFPFGTIWTWYYHYWNTTVSVYELGDSASKRKTSWINVGLFGSMIPNQSTLSAAVFSDSSGSSGWRWTSGWIHGRAAGKHQSIRIRLWVQEGRQDVGIAVELRALLCHQIVIFLSPSLQHPYMFPSSPAGPVCATSVFFFV